MTLTNQELDKITLSKSDEKCVNTSKRYSNETNSFTCKHSCASSFQSPTVDHSLPPSLTHSLPPSLIHSLNHSPHKIFVKDIRRLTEVLGL